MEIDKFVKAIANGDTASTGQKVPFIKADLRETVDEINKRFAPKRGPDDPFRSMSIRLLDDEVVRMHWAGGSSLKHMASQILRVDAFPKCPACKAECCLGHPDNGCELQDVYNVSET